MRTTTPDPLATISTGTPLTGTTTAVATMTRTGNIPGLSVAVVDRDRDPLRRRIRPGRPGPRHTVHCRHGPPVWFSMTKIVTATAALGLADDGRLDLDAPAAEYVSGLRPRGVEQPTVRQLLTHTAGLATR